MVTSHHDSFILPSQCSQACFVPGEWRSPSRQEFERRYEATPHINKAELIEGTVYMARLLSGFKIMDSLMQT